jgi:hypothetical protein
VTDKYRNEFPKLFEILDAQPTSQDVAFPALDQTIDDFPPKGKVLRDIEAELKGLDLDAWNALKAKLIPLPKRDKARGLQPLYDILNEAKGYNHLLGEACTNVHFIPVSASKTPDLGADDPQGGKVLCDVKTINISKDEADRRRFGDVGTSSNRLTSGFLGKVKADLEYAKAQMVGFNRDSNVRKIVFIVVNYDDSFHEYADDYWPQIKQFLSDNPIPDVEVHFDIRPPFYMASI